MKRFIAASLLLCLFIFSGNLKATHIVGGYLSYDCLGPDPVNPGFVDYRITMRIFVDCQFGNPNAFPTFIPITVFGNNGVIVDSTIILTNLISSDTLDPNINNPCVVPDNSVCVREFVFDGTVSLAANQAHAIVHQRCCKSSQVDNLPPPSGDFGSTYAIEIPAFNLVNCNSTPVYDTIPPLYFCVGFDVNIDLSATDPDPNDSLVYSLCSPLSYNDRMNPAPQVASQPPYAPLTFDAPFSPQDPFPANPQLTIDSRTGRLNGTPSNIGRYVFGVCIEEYRNGVLLNTYRREIEVTTRVCDVIVNSAVQMQEQFCDGLTVQFGNNSTPNTINNYFWDFGVSGVASDTSVEFEPQFTYPAPGNYTITLISYPAFPACSSVTTANFEVRPLLEPGIVTDGLLCRDSNSVDFSVGGAFSSAIATYRWDFGTAASIAQSTSETVDDVEFTGAEPYPVQLIVSENNCSDTIMLDLGLFDNPTVDFSLSDSAGCFPLPVTFNPTVSPQSGVEYLWDFGDNTSSTLESPTHTYTANGIYDVSLRINTTSGCVDTLTLVKEDAVVVSLDSSTNEVGFIISQDTGCAPIEVFFTDTSIFEGAANFKWFFGDGDSSTLQNPSHIYDDEGIFDVQLILETTEKCVDTLSLTIPASIEIDRRFSTNVVDFDFFPKEGCAPLTIQFSDSSFAEGDIEYFWDLDNNVLSTDQNPVFTYDQPGTYSVGLLIITSNQCVDTINKVLNDTIRVLEIPNANVTASDTSKSVKEANFTFTNAGSSSFQNSRYIVNGVETSTDEVINLDFFAAGTYEIVYIATNNLGCEDTASVSVVVFDEFQFMIPNVFTPNGDGINDQFSLINCGVSSEDFQLSIFNRFGVEVFQTKAIGIEWDGRIQGKEASPGVYYYVIRLKDFNGEDIEYNGTVTLLRD